MTSESRPEPTFSVITIFHNEERFLADAVASVAAQTGPSWELVLVDDGSTDRSADVARVLANAFPRWIHYVAHPGGGNRGMSASRNLGIEHASGEFVTFLDADDVWLPGKLAAQLSLLRSHPDVDVLVAPAEWWRSWDSDGSGHDHCQQLVDGEAAYVLAPPPTLARDFLVDEWQSICDLVVARSLIHEVGGYETTFTAMFEDQVFHTKLLSRHRALVTRRHWYRYRQHDAACTATSHERGSHAMWRRRYLDWAINHLDSGSRPPDVNRDEWEDYVDLVRRQRGRARRTDIIQQARRRGRSLLDRSPVERRRR